MLIGAGFIVGVLVGRWWALAPALGFAVWIAIASGLEVPGWFLGLMCRRYRVRDIATGIVVHRAIHRLSRARRCSSRMRHCLECP